MRTASWFLLLACFCQTATAQSDALVGDFGDPERLVIEATRPFTSKQVKDRLLLIPAFHLAADSNAPLDKYLLTIERLIGAGYRHAGFRDVEVNVATDLKANTIKVHITEGSRYTAGAVRVRGNKTIPVAQLISRLTTKYPPKDALMPSPTERNGKLESQWVDQSGKSVSLCDAIWQVGKPAHFLTVPEANSKLHRDVADAFPDLGYRWAKFTVDVVPDPTTKKADLVVDVLDEGERSILAKIEVTGNKINSQEDIIKYLEFKLGTPATRDEQARIQSKLWQSGRFIRSSVTIYHPATIVDNASLQINVLELYKATPLNKPLSPEEECLLKCRNWLADHSRWDGDVVCNVTSTDNSSCIVFSPMQGVLAHAKWKDPSGQKPVDCIGVASTEEMGLYNLLGNRKISMPSPNGQLIGSLALSLCDSANDANDAYHQIGFGFWTKSDRLDLKSPFDLALSVAPVYFVEMAHAPDTTVAIRNGVLTVTSPKMTMRADVKTGKVLQYVETWPDEETSDAKSDEKAKATEKTPGYQENNAPAADQTTAKTPSAKPPFTLRLTMIPGEFQRQLNAVHAETAKIPNAFDAKRPFSSTLAFACKEDLLWQYDGAEKYANARTLVRQIADKNLLEPFDKKATDYFAKSDESSGGDDYFSIPDADAVGISFNFDSSGAFVTVGYIIQELAPSGSWPEVMSRDVLMILSGHGNAANVELLRLYKSEKSGPLCFLAASWLLAQQNPPMAQMMASRGLRRLSLDEFQKEYKLLLDPKLPVGQFALRIIEFLRDADDRDIESLASLLPEERAKQLRPVVALVRMNRNQPAEQTLKTILDALWQNGLREYVKTTLEALEKAAKPNIEQSRYRPRQHAERRAT